MNKNIQKPWLIWGVAAFFYLYEMILRVSPSVMIEGLTLSFDTTSTMLGVLISFYYYSYTFLQIPSGIIMDRLGSKNLIVLSTILCSVGSVIFASTTQMYSAQIGRFFVGAGSACAFVSCLHIGSSLFPNKFALIAGVTNMMGTIGGLFGGVPVAILVNKIGWKETTYVLALLGVLTTIMALIFIPKKLGIRPISSGESIIKSISEVLYKKQVVFFGVIAGLMYLPISAFSELWAIPFFMARHSLNNEMAGVASAILFLGVAIGSIILAMVSEYMGSCIKTIRYSALATSILFVVLVYHKSSVITSFCLVFFIGIFTGAQVLNFLCAKNSVHDDLSGTTLAFTNTLVMLTGAIFQPVLGILIDLFWDGKISYEGMRQYDISCYSKSILSLSICLVVAYLLVFFVSDTHVKLKHAKNR
ncbi:MAG: MFS transporter [Holosporales bacterium]|jgi:MFS family permease|nr:MFS transporter [Holosporales bacterium]